MGGQTKSDGLVEDGLSWERWTWRSSMGNGCDASGGGAGVVMRSIT